MLLEISTQPAPIVAPGVRLPGFTADISTHVDVFEDLTRLWVIASLVDRDGKTDDAVSDESLSKRLSGTRVDSAHPIPENVYGCSTLPGPDYTGAWYNFPDPNPIRKRAYFHFHDLVIKQPGHYRIRVTLFQVDYSSSASAPEGEVIVRDSVDSSVISVEENEPSKQTCQTATRDSNKTRLVWRFLASHHPTATAARHLVTATARRRPIIVTRARRPAIAPAIAPAVTI
jgi:hypothetical protein